MSTNNSSSNDACYNTVEANFPTRSADPFKSDMFPPKEVAFTHQDVREFMNEVTPNQSVHRKLFDEFKATPPNMPKPKSFDDTKKLIETFKEKTANYPKYLSYDGSMVLCVLLSLNDNPSTSLNHLPQVDIETIKTMLPKWPMGPSFDVCFDKDKDFVLYFENGDMDRIKISMINSVAHPRAEDLRGGDVPVENDGDKIAVGGKIVMNKKTIQKIMGFEPKGQAKDATTEEADPSITRRQPVAGRNAYEIRADVLQMAIDWAGKSNTMKFSPKNEDDVIALAKKFYSFVENRR